VYGKDNRILYSAKVSHSCKVVAANERGKLLEFSMTARKSARQETQYPDHFIRVILMTSARRVRAMTLSLDRHISL
jgi:hypothetical protein